MRSLPLRDITKVMFDAATLHLLNINLTEKCFAQRSFYAIERGA